VKKERRQGDRRHPAGTTPWGKLPLRTRRQSTRLEMHDGGEDRSGW
jgi:hypothetical protein